MKWSPFFGPPAKRGSGWRSIWAWDGGRFEARISAWTGRELECWWACLRLRWVPTVLLGCLRRRFERANVAL
jgi:hypothetical protein